MNYFYKLFNWFKKPKPTDIQSADIQSADDIYVGKEIQVSGPDDAILKIATLSLKYNKIITGNSTWNEDGTGIIKIHTIS